MDNVGALSGQDRFLIENAVIGYQKAKDLLAWWKAKETAGALKKLTLNPPDRPELHVDYFYDALILEGKDVSAQGCFWKSRFQRNPNSSPGPTRPAPSSEGPAEPATTLQTFIQKQFTRRSHWTHPDGLPGGFEFKPLQYKLQGRDDYGVSPEGPAPDLDEIGAKYDWVVFEAVVYDFFRNVPGLNLGPGMLKKMPKMSSYVLIHKDYYSSFHPPVAGTVAECCFGYSFLPTPVTKGIFGYGPGMFKAAVKQFRFILLDSGDIEIQMFFLVSPRSEKILNLGGFDPVYFSANLANILTLSAFNLRQRAHDKMDALQLELHARVYQSLLNGMRTYWENQNWRGAGQ
jgi:hypothetical protein